MKFLHALSVIAFSALTTIASPTPQTPPPPEIDETFFDISMGFGTPWFCCQGMCPTEATEDPQVVDEIHHKQITETLPCSPGGGTCSVGTTEAYTIGYFIDIGGMIPWASVGFGVSQSWTSSTTKTCGGATGDQTCMWTRTPMKSYSVRKKIKYALADTCKDGKGAFPGQPDGPYRVTAPSGPPEFYCVNGNACRAQGQGYIEYPNEKPREENTKPQ